MRTESLVRFIVLYCTAERNVKWHKVGALKRQRRADLWMQNRRSENIAMIV